MLLGKMNNMIIHFVGNKNNGDGVRFSNVQSNFERIEEYFKRLIYSNFKSDELFRFDFSQSVESNPIHQCTSIIFNDINSFVEQSKNLTRFLYDNSIHPKIKSGEFYIVYFKDCVIDDTTTDAIGLFKSENKETILKVSPEGEGFEIEIEKGMNINKLDKGCLIFNIEKENGYVISIVDNTNKSIEAQYWKDDFLHIKPRKDEYYNTQNVLTLCKNFVTEELSQQSEVSKADQVDLLNKSVEYFKKNENFDMEDFAKVVMRKQGVIESFNQYKSDYEFAKELSIMDNFAISESAVKKQARALKSVIKLDKNFHIYVHGDSDLIEQGADEKGRKYYKIYYSIES